MKKRIISVIRTILWFLKRFQIRKESHLSSIIFLMKNKCNAKCIMCGLDYFGNKMPAEITYEKYLQILSNLKMKDITNLTFSGGGEPLLARDFKKIVEYTTRVYPRKELGIYTNGISLSEKNRNIIVSNGFKYVTISINAATKETYKKIMGVDKFDLVLNNVEKLVKLKRQNQNIDIFIEFSFVASELNINELPDFVRLGVKLGVDLINVQYSRMYTGKVGISTNTVNVSIDSTSSLFYHQKLSDKIMIKSETLAKVLSIGFRREVLFAEKVEPKPCGVVKKMIMIDPDGDIFPCGGGEVMFHKSVKNNKLNFGNLLNEGIDKVLRREDFGKLERSCQLSNNSKEIQQCYNCNHTIQWLGAKHEKSHFIEIDF